MARPLSHSGAGDASIARSAASRSIAAQLFLSLRPDQWTKNLVVFAGLVFGQRLTTPGEIGRAGAAFAIFCGLSGAVYLLNDVVDREADTRHPIKRFRPIASGGLSSQVAIGAAVMLGAAAMAAAVWVGRGFALTAGAYLVLLAAYSAILKHVVILDVLTIASGFVLRAAAGAQAVGVPISQWLLVCTILLALFLALSKRRHELTLLLDGAAEHRPILGEYSPHLLDQMIAVVTASTLISYSLYTTSPETVARFGTTRLSLTIPFVLYGIFRYLYLVHQKREGGSPSTMLINDRPLLACVALWAVSVAVILYTPIGR